MSTTLNIGELLNLVGLSTGVVGTMWLVMVVRAGRAPGAHAHEAIAVVVARRIDAIPLATERFARDSEGDFTTLGRELNVRVAI